MRIAIIGGGIGGLAAALALRQAGFAPEVFEQAPEFLEVGAAIIMWPNAMRVLDRLGVGETLRRHGGIVEQTRWLNRDGKLLNQIRLPVSDAPAVALHRAELQKALLQALPENTIHLDHAFRSYDLLPDKIVAHFTGSRSFECDVLIGADGLHSHVREQLLHDGPPIDRGYFSWRGVMPYTPRSIPPTTAIEVYGSGRRFGVGPVGGGRIGWWATANQNQTSLPDDPTANHDGEVNRAELLRLFTGWCEPVLELIENTPLSSLVRNTVFDRYPSRKWGDGCLTLMGDAIHPTTPNLGQGGCLAIEDAVVLARCLEKYSGVVQPGNKTQVSTALRRYEELRFARTAAIARYSRIYGSAGQWENRWAVLLRETMLSSFPAALTRRLLAGLFNYDAACATSR